MIALYRQHAAEIKIINDYLRWVFIGGGVIRTNTDPGLHNGRTFYSDIDAAITVYESFGIDVEQLRNEILDLRSDYSALYPDLEALLLALPTGR